MTLCFFCELIYYLHGEYSMFIWSLRDDTLSLCAKKRNLISRNPICYASIETSVLSVASGIKALVNSIVWSGSMNWFDYAVSGDPGKPGHVVAGRAHIFRRGEFLCCVVNLDST